MKRIEDGFEELRLDVADRNADAMDVHIEAFIAEDGDLVMYGTESGKATRELLGRSDCQYWVTVPEYYKEWVLLHLLRDRFGGATAATTEFMGWLKDRNIPHELESS